LLTLGTARGEQSRDEEGSLQKSQVERRKRISRHGLGSAVDESAVNESDVAEQDDDEGVGDNNEPEEVDEPYESITKISQPYYVYPTTVLPRSRGLENMLQPLLYTPVSCSFIPASIYALPSLCCGGMQGPFQQRRNELDLITGDIEMGVNDRSAAGAVNAEMERLLGVNGRRGSSSDGPPQSAMKQTGAFNVHRQDGLYQNRLPIFADILMGAEDVDSLPIAKLVESNVGLARVTQRTLRELQGGLDNERMRRLWSTMLASKPALSTQAPKQRKLSGRNASDGEFNRADSLTEDPTQRTPLPSIAELLNQLSVGPVLRIIDDPVIDLPCQPVVPSPCVSYGGQLGNWPDDSSNERLGGSLQLLLKATRLYLRSLTSYHSHDFTHAETFLSKQSIVELLCSFPLRHAISSPTFSNTNTVLS
jgi:hypothetical protein